MKADAKPSAEVEALSWATAEFRRCPHLLQHGGTEKNYWPRIIPLLRQHGESVLDDEVHAWSGRDEAILQIANLAREGEQASHTLLLEVAASRLQRGKSLGDPLRDYLVAFLRNPKAPRRPRGRKQSSNQDRDAFIYCTLAIISLRWGFTPTRNAATDTPSATSIAQQALSNAGINISEAAVTKIWNGWKQK